MSSIEELEVPISSTLLLELQGVVPKLLNYDYSGGGKIPVDRRDLARFLELVDKIRSEAGEPAT